MVNNWEYTERLETVNHRKPNFIDKNGKFFLVRCFICNPKHGKENYAINVSTGQCTWCGWKVDLGGIK